METYLRNYYIVAEDLVYGLYKIANKNLWKLVLRLLEVLLTRWSELPLSVPNNTQLWWSCVEWLPISLGHTLLSLCAVSSPRMQSRGGELTTHLGELLFILRLANTIRSVRILCSMKELGILLFYNMIWQWRRHYASRSIRTSAQRIRPSIISIFLVTGGHEGRAT
jgi:hypothetical protein